MSLNEFYFHLFPLFDFPKYSFFIIFFNRPLNFLKRSPFLKWTDSIALISWLLPFFNSCLLYFNILSSIG